MPSRTYDQPRPVAAVVHGPGLLGRGLAVWTRTAVLTSTCAVLAAAGHVLGGGRSPSPLQLLAVVVLLLPLVRLALDGEATAPVLLTIVAGLQVLLHLVFALLAGSGPSSGSGGHLVHAAQMPGMAGAGAPAYLAVPSVAMLLGHAAAATAVAVLLRHGERAVFALVRLGRVVRARAVDLALRLATCSMPVSVPAAAWRRCAFVRAAPDRLRTQRLMQDVLTRRGPPARLA